MKFNFSTDEDCAKRLDLDDSLANFRSQFCIPTQTIYLDGNSLGLLPKAAERSLLRMVNEWKTLGIQG